MATDTRHDMLVRELRALGASAPEPAVHPGFVDTVLARVTDLPEPAPESTWGRRTGAVGALLADRRRRVAAALVVVLAGLLLTPPVRAAVSEWFGFAGVQIRQGPVPDGTPEPPEAQGPLTLTQARELVGFEPVVPAELGPPDAVQVSDDRRVLSMSWSDETAGTVRMDTFDARVDYTFVKQTPDAYFTEVNDRFAVWFDRPHQLALVEADGTRREEAARLAAQTLIWEVGSTGIRLEGDFTRARAVAIAESATPSR